MKSLMTTLLAAAVIAAAAPGASAADGILIHEQTTTGGKTETHQIQIDQHRMRADTTTGAGEKQAIVFDGTKKVMLIINYDKKTYTETTQDEVNRMSGQVSDAMAKMQEQMKNLPPEQRARVEAMMAGRGGMAGAAGGGAVKTEYQENRRRSRRQVELRQVRRFARRREDDRALHRRAADARLHGRRLRGDERSPGVLRQARAKERRQSVWNRLAADQGFSGVPVRRVTFGPGASTSELLDVTRQTIPDSAFAVPDGFQKQASPFGGRGRK